MAKFKITPTTTVAELKEQFSNEVGGVLRVYKGQSEATDGATLVSLGAKEGELECRTSRTVGKFEEAFQNDLNLKVRVYTKDNWVKVLDGITLASAAELPNGMTKAKMEEFLSYQRESKEEETAEVVEETVNAVEVPEEYKGLPIIEITTEEIDVEDPYGSFASYPTFGVVFHGYADNGRQAMVIMADRHKDLCKQAAKDIEKYIESDEDIPVKVIETKTITGYGEADDVEEIKGVIGVALNEYYDGGWKHLYQYDWESWFPNEAIFCIDDDVFVASKDGSIDFIDLSDEQLDKLKSTPSVENVPTNNFGKVSDDILNSVEGWEFSDGIAGVEINGKWGFIDEEGNIVIEPKFDGVPNNIFETQGVAQVEVNGKHGFIDKSGNFVIEPKFEKLGYDFVDGLMKAKVNDKWGFIDKSGNFILEPKFDNLGTRFNNGLVEAEINGKWGYIDKSGNFVIEPKYDSADFFCNGYAKVELGGEKFKIDVQGNRVG